jgi:hypothetical protein
MITTVLRRIAINFKVKGNVKVKVVPVFKYRGTCWGAKMTALIYELYVNCYHHDPASKKTPVFSVEGGPRAVTDIGEEKNLRRYRESSPDSTVV